MVRRRDFLDAFAATAGIVTLAGCSGDSDEADSDGDVLGDRTEDPADDADGDDTGSEDDDAGADDTEDEEEAPVQAAVGVHGDGTDAVDVEFTSTNNADGLAVVDESRTVVEDGLLENVGATEEIDEPGSYAVYGYLGSPTEGEPLDSHAEATTLLAEFEVE